MSAQFDVVGTEMGCRGRSCQAHPICGIQVHEGTLLRLRLVDLCVEGLAEVAIAVYLDKEGQDGCRVGFAPRHLIHHYREYDGALARCIAVYSRHDETSSIKRRKVHHNHGFAVAELVANEDSGSNSDSENGENGENAENE